MFPFTLEFKIKNSYILTAGLQKEKYIESFSTKLTGSVQFL